MSRLIKENLFVYVAFFLLTAAFTLPGIFSIFVYPDGYSPLTTSRQLYFMEEETYIYSAHVNQMSRGLFLGDPYVWEYRFSPTPYFGEVGSLLPLVFLAVLSGSTSLGFLLSDFIFPTLLGLIIFFGLRKVGYGKYFSLASALAVIITPYLSSLFPKIVSYGTRLTGDEGNVLFFTRTPHPQISSLFLFGAIFLTVLFLKAPTKRNFYLFVAFIGICVYSTPFISSTVFLGTLFLVPLILKRVSFRTIVGGIFLGLFITIPYFVNMLYLRNLLENSDFLLRTTFPVHFLFPIQLRYIAISLLLLFLTRSKLSIIFLSYILAASLISDGHQFITGRNLEADHWLTRVMAPIATLCLFLVTEWLTKHFHFKQAFRIWKFSILVLVLFAFYTQMNWLMSHQLNFSSQRSFDQVIRFIVNNTNDNDVIGTLNIKLNKYLGGIGKRRVYLPPGDRTIASSHEQAQRLCDLLYLTGGNQKYKLERPILNYSFGFYVWLKSDTSEIEKNILDCVKSSSGKISYKLDYMVVQDSGGIWSITSIEDKR